MSYEAFLAITWVQSAECRVQKRVFSQDVTAAILVSQNNETAAMLVSQTSPVGVELFFLCKRFLLFQKICIDAGHVSEHTLQLFREWLSEKMCT